LRSGEGAAALGVFFFAAGALMARPVVRFAWNEKKSLYSRSFLFEFFFVVFAIGEI
jgi:hypothetical protein